jgi:ATP-dependent helicase HepA
MQASIVQLLSEASKSLAQFLEKVLPSLFNDWWNETVVNHLSFHQWWRVRERGINTLTSLDLSALLRVLDQNWYQISTKLNLTSEQSHFIKKM